MKKEVKYLISFLRFLLSFGVGAYFFPNYVYASDYKIWIAASAAMVLLGLSYGMVAKRVSKFLMSKGQYLKMFVFSGVSLFILPINMMIVSAFMPGFQINGFLTIVLLTLSVMNYKLKVKLLKEPKKMNSII